MKIRTEDSLSVAALLALSLVCAALLIWQAGVLWLASHRLASGNLELMRRGAALTPGDGSAWDSIGHLRQWDLANQNLPGAIADFERAIQDDPRSARYWVDLAGAREAAGNFAQAGDAYAHAEADYPDSAEVAFDYGNFLLRQGNYPDAWRKLRRAVRTDPSLLPLVISRTWRATEDAEILLDNVLPRNVPAYSQALSFFASIHQGDPALAVWRRMMALGQKVPLPGTFPFFEEMIQEGRSGDAARAWPEALAAAGWPRASAADQSVVWDGDFTADFTNGGLGWRWSSMPGVIIDFDSAPPPEGGRAVRLDFNGGMNTDLEEPYEYVPVEPGRAYHFRGWLRTEAITTESGIRFQITDPFHAGAVNVQTEDFTATRPWTPRDADLTTGPQTHFLTIRLFRAPSRMFENRLSGTAWMANLSLVPAGAGTEQAPQ